MTTIARRAIESENLRKRLLMLLIKEKNKVPSDSILCFGTRPQLLEI